MSRYIDADAFVEHIEELQKLNSKDDCFCGNLQAFKSIINFQPTADVVEVVRGVWLNTTHGVMCSVCESIQIYGSRYYKYCPICGARMVEE